MRATRRIGLAAATAMLTLAAAALAVTYHAAVRTSNFRLGPNNEKQYLVPYPHALQYANATYDCTVKKLQPMHIPAGKFKPKLGKVKLVSKGPSQGGSVCLVTVQNKNADGTAPVRIRIAASTRWTT